MKTSDFRINISSEKLNESLQQKFGGKVDIQNFTDSELIKASKLIENKISAFKKADFNATLENEEFFKLKLMKDVIDTRMREVFGEAKKSPKKKPDADGDGVPDWADKKPGKDDNEGKKPAKKGMSAKQEKFFGKKKKTSETIMRESIQRYLREGEEGKAEVIMAVKDMVDKFTGWSEDIAQMQANTAMEMADSIRDELGSDVAEQFKQAATPALDSAFQAVKAAREALNGMVGTITGEGAPAMGGEEMGAEPAPGGEEMGAEPEAEMGAEPAPDMGAEPEADAGGVSPEGREKRESIERTRRLSRILVGR